MSFPHSSILRIIVRWFMCVAYSKSFNLSKSRLCHTAVATILGALLIFLMLIDAASESQDIERARLGCFSDLGLAALLPRAGVCVLPPVAFSVAVASVLSIATSKRADLSVPKTCSYD